MYTHAAEIVAEAWLHEGTSCRIEWLAPAPQDFVDDGRSFGQSSAAGTSVLPLYLLVFLIRLAFVATSAAGTFTLHAPNRAGYDGARVRHAHHPTPQHRPLRVPADRRQRRSAA